MAKVTSEELKQIQDIESRYHKIIYDLGKNEADIISAQLYTDGLKENKEFLTNDLKKNVEENEALKQELGVKYGKGGLDIQTGEITPVE